MRTFRPSCPACWQRFFPTARTSASAVCFDFPTRTFGSMPALTVSPSSPRTPTFSSVVCFTDTRPKSSGSASATALDSNSFSLSRLMSRTSTRSTLTHSRRFSSSRSNEAPNHALQRTAPGVTVAASGLRLSAHHAGAAPPSAVAELEVVSRFYTHENPKPTIHESNDSIIIT